MSTNHSTSPREQERHSRKLRAQQRGYRPDDEVFYSAKLIARILPYALDTYATAPPTVADEGTVNRSHAGKGDGYGGFEAAVADVRAALDTLPPLERRLVTLAWRGGFTVGWLASRLGRTAEHVHDRLKWSLKQMQFFLGGSNPYTGGVQKWQ